MCPPSAPTDTPTVHRATLDKLPSHLLPTSDLSKATLSFAASAVTQAVLNHSFRVSLYAKWLASQENFPLSDRQADLLFAAAICHDIGTSPAHNGSQRFEIEGADAAKSFLRTHGASEAEAQQVWVAVALHSTPGIAERIDPFTRIIRLAVLIDFVAEKREELGADGYAAEIEALVPRLDIEKVLGDAVVEQALAQRSKAPLASWPGVLVRAHLEDPGWTGVNNAF